MSHDDQQELKAHLQSTLLTLNRLADQIRETKDYSEHAEYILCLRELVLEQMGNPKNEDTGRTTHAPR